jgi:hypothetical protein
MFPDSKYGDAKDSAIEKAFPGDMAEEGVAPEDESTHADLSVEDLYAIATPEQRAVLEELCNKADEVGGAVPEAV